MVYCKVKQLGHEVEKGRLRNYSFYQLFIWRLAFGTGNVIRIVSYAQRRQQNEKLT